MLQARHFFKVRPNWCTAYTKILGQIVHSRTATHTYIHTCFNCCRCGTAVNGCLCCSFSRALRPLCWPPSRIWWRSIWHVSRKSALTLVPLPRSLHALSLCLCMYASFTWFLLSCSNSFCCPGSRVSRRHHDPHGIFHMLWLWQFLTHCAWQWLCSSPCLSEREATRALRLWSRLFPWSRQGTRPPTGWSQLRIQIRSHAWILNSNMQSCMDLNSNT